MLSSIAKRRLEKIQGPKPPSVEDHWTPNAGPQFQFYHSTCREILYGGAAGGGKSSALTALLLKYSHLEGFLGVVFRRTSGQFNDLISKSEELFPKVHPGLKPVYSPHFVWEFPAGGTANYRHCQHDKNAKDYDGWEINFLGFDELTHFTKKQYLALCARVRNAKPGLPTIIRATSNPGGEGHEWVFERWGAWLNPDFEAKGLETRLDTDGKRLPPAKPGEVLWVRRVKGEEVYSRENTGQGALSRTFIPALASDNPHLTESDPDYLAQLEELDPVTRQQLLYGDWLIKPAAGYYFHRSWVEFVDAVPQTGVIARIRAWDFAGTEKTEKKSDPDWTAGVELAITRDAVYVEHVCRFRGNPGTVKDTVRSTAELDGRKTVIFIPQDPGQAGKSQIFDYSTALRGWALVSRPVTGDKISRFRPFSSYANPRIGGAKRVFVVRGAWNSDYLDELEQFPEGNKDDQVDATSDAFSTLSELVAKRRTSGGLIAVNNSDR